MTRRENSTKTHDALSADTDWNQPGVSPLAGVGIAGGCRDGPKMMDLILYGSSDLNKNPMLEKSGWMKTPNSTVLLFAIDAAASRILREHCEAVRRYIHTNKRRVA